MNWNGAHKNGVLADAVACREGIQVVRQRGSKDGAEWLLAQVDPEENTAALISLVFPFTVWADKLEEEVREEWLVWAMTNHPIEVRQWMGYKPDWTMIPAPVCKRLKEMKRLTRKSGLPSLYLLPGTPRRTKNKGSITLDNGLEMIGIRKKTVTYVEWSGEWYKVFYPKLPSKSAVSRAIRLYLTGVLLGRGVTSTNDLKVYEMFGLKDWLLGTPMDETGLFERSSRTLFHLLISPDTVEQLPNG